ncbi:hypothetical protein Moror_7661 [Moniliophthora roreri MCA 2997]|uniref:F-box domain-containing protein n=1 Tax=Moniliophthora roreri (strain MCA 2997) TaxID=1381753 RepID=V2WTV6_MONRO|nr:hypothetical protein Moror_7661 [Moniliophthora roreri MCA 2997]
MLEALDGYCIHDTPATRIPDIELPPPISERLLPLTTTNAYPNYLASARFLPEYILVRIFGHYCANDSVDVLENEHYYKHPVTVPWTLGQVCFRWRALVQSTSTLWTYVSIIFPPHNASRQRLQAIYSRLETHLRNSGTQLLNICLCAQEIASFSPSVSLLELICSRSDRWEGLRLEFMGIERNVRMNFLAYLSRLIKGRIPALRRLFLDVGSDARTGAFEISPGLREVAVRDGLGFIKRVPLPYEHIRLWHSHNWGIDSTLLREMPHLSDLRIDGEFPFLREYSLFQSLETLTCLSLACKSSHTNGFAHFFGWADLPNLREFRLYLQWHDEDELSFTEVLVPFLSRCGAIKSFWYASFNDRHGDEGGVEFLEALPPSLESLTLIYPYYPLLDALGDRETLSDTPRLFPNLKQLGVVPLPKCSSWEECMTKIVRLRTSRQKTGLAEVSGLERVWVDELEENMKELVGLCARKDIQFNGPSLPWNSTELSNLCQLFRDFRLAPPDSAGEPEVLD